MKPPLPAAARRLGPRLTAWRHQLHQQPELGFQEHGTAAFLDRELAALGLTATAVGGTGRLVRLGGEAEGPTVLLRADIDALPITEVNRVDWVSRRPGLMHACGHDAHTACLLGALALLNGAPLPRGRVLGLFQPAEEPTPGGAERLVADGLLETEGVDRVLAQHVDHTLPVGTLGVRAGAMMARSDRFEVTFTGPGGHAAERAAVPDPLAAAVAFHRGLDEALDEERNRSAPPGAEGRVVGHIGRLEAGRAENIIPTEARLTGTLRTFDEELAARLRAALDRLARAAAADGTEARTIWHLGAPAVRNDPGLTARLRAVWQAGLGVEQVVELTEPALAAEDFGHLSSRRPAVFWRLGIRGPERGGEPWHTPRFDVDDAALPVGAWALAAAASSLLKDES
jgi:amidohydrolase